MFSTLESTWDHTPRRRWSTFASFSMQTLALSLVLALPMMWVQGPPQLWFAHHDLIPPPAQSTPAPPEARHFAHPAGAGHGPMLPAVRVADPNAVVDRDLPPAPEMPGFATSSDRGDARSTGVSQSIGDPSVAPPPIPRPTAPIRMSHWAEGNLVYRVQPVYPPLAKQARIQGTVGLRAIISKTGAIEQLTVLSGPPMLTRSAIEAVRQWRYRPYFLNGEPVEVETEITVNFVLTRE